MNYKKNYGFTLLETLVSLLIFTLIAILLSSMIGFSLELRVSAIENIKNWKFNELQQFWFRSVISSVILDYTDKNDSVRFYGNEQQIHGITISPLNGISNVPTEFTWKIEETKTGKYLIYYENNLNKNSWVIKKLSMDFAEFSYLKDNKLYNKWPKENFDEKTPFYPLPDIIVLNASNQFRKKFTWIANIIYSEQYRIDFRNLND